MECGFKLIDKNITEDMLIKFNCEFLQDSPLELRMCKNLPGCAECRLKYNEYIDTSIINLNNKFFDILIFYFQSRFGIELSFNNSGNIFWAKNQ